MDHENILKMESKCSSFLMLQIKAWRNQYQTRESRKGNIIFRQGEI